MYDFTPEMGEISGFGGGYEQMCRAMLRAGLEFYDRQSETFNPKFRGYQGIYGFIDEDNQDAELLTEAVMDAVIMADDGKVTRARSGATGAMHQAVITALLWIRKNGWDAYVKEMSKERA